MKLSVVIVNYNVRDYLLVCLDSVYKAEKELGEEIEVFVVDNNSKYKPESDLKRFFPKVIYLQNNENLGFGRANNIAIRLAKGDYVLLLNPDTIVPEDCFKQIFDFLEHKDNVGVVGIRGVSGHGTVMPEHRRNVPSMGNLVIKFLRLDKFLLKHKLYTQTYYDYSLNNKTIGEIDVTSGSFLMVHKALVKELSLFDERYFMFFEDTDLCLDIKKAGYKIFYLPISFLHFKSTSYNRNDINFHKNFADNMLIFAGKHSKGSVSLFFLKILLKSYLLYASVVCGLKHKDIEQSVLPPKYIYTTEYSYRQIIEMVEEEAGKFDNVICNPKYSVCIKSLCKF